MDSSIVIDYLGKEFQCRPYKRIVSLVPSITELLFDFGLEKNVVGVTKFCVHPKRAIETPRTILGGTKNPDVDLIHSLKPDLVILNKEENRLRHFTLLQEKQIPTFVIYPRSVDNSINMIQSFIKLFQIDTPTIFDKFNSLNSVYKEIKEVIFKISPENRKKVFCPIWKHPWMSFNQDTFSSSIIEICGGINIFTGHHDRYPKITIEEVIKKDPDIILLPDEPYRFQEIDKFGLLSIQELKEKQIELVDGTFHWYSFRMEKSLKLITSILYP